MMLEFKRNQTRKLTLEQVMELREYAKEGATQGALAKHYGVSVGQVGRIVRGESWMEGGKQGVMSQANQDRVLEKLLLVQEQVQRGEEGKPVSPPTRTPPPMMLEGGDAPEEVDGKALSKLQQQALAFGLDMDKVLAMEEGK